MQTDFIAELIEDQKICYIATHTRSGRQYVGITERSLAIRKAEHESHAESGTFGNNIFHTAIRKYGKDEFSWNVLAQGSARVMEILESVLIFKLNTLAPNGFNSVNQASESECPTDEYFSFAEDMDTCVAEIDMVYDMLDILVEAMNNPRFNTKTKELMSALIQLLKSGDGLGTQ